MNRRQYNVAVKHPTGFHSGTKTLTVTDNTTRDGTRYVYGAGFGCSRDYRTADDAAAIRLFMAEHACTVVRCARADQ